MAKSAVPSTPKSNQVGKPSLAHNGHPKGTSQRIVK